MSVVQDWKQLHEERRNRLAANMQRLFADGKEKRSFLRKVLESWDLGDLEDVITNYYSDRIRSKSDAVDEILSEGMLDDDIDETIQHEIDERKAVVQELVVKLYGELRVVAHQDCDHMLEGKPDFDLLDRCRFCARPKAECEG